MKYSLSTASLLVALLSATCANALTRIAGVITSVDHANNAVVITDKNGRSEAYTVASHTRIVVEGKESGLSALAPAQTVTIAIPAAEPEYVRAKILDVDLATGVAVVQALDTKAIVTVQLTAATKVGGKVRRLEELAEGQTIKIRYAINS